MRGPEQEKAPSPNMVRSRDMQKIELSPARRLERVAVVAAMFLNDPRDLSSLGDEFERFKEKPNSTLKSTDRVAVSCPAKDIEKNYDWIDKTEAREGQTPGGKG